jgi:hypothetical protein
MDKKILDSALIVGIFSAFCYALGFLVELRDAREIGLPHHLLPESSAQATILIGATHLILLAAVCLIGYALVLVLLRFIPQKWRSAISGYIVKRFEAHRVFSIVICIVVVGTLFTIIATEAPLSPSAYTEAPLPTIVKLQLKHPNHVPQGKLEYLSHRDHLIVLKHKDKREFVILNDDELESMELVLPDLNNSKGEGKSE